MPRRKKKPLTPEALRFLNALHAGELTSDQARRRLPGVASMLDDDHHSEALELITRMERDELLRKEEADALFALVPDGWLRRYMAYSKTSESPMMFHLACGVAGLSHILGSSRWWQVHNDRILPPTSVFLVSPAGITRRGNAVRSITRILKMAEASVIQDTATMEGLLTYVSKHPHSVIISEEAAMLFSKKEYMRGIVEFMCRYIDCDEAGIEQLLKKGKLRIPNPIGSGIFGCAPDWLPDMPTGVTGGGLMSRLWSIYESTKERSLPFPFAGRKDAERSDRAREALVEEMLAIRELPGGPLRFKGATKARYTAFYEANDREGKRAPAKIVHWYGRKPAHLMRLLMTLTASSHRPPVVDGDLFDRAVSLMSMVEERMVHVYEHAALTSWEKKRQAIIDTIKSLGGEAKRSQIMPKVRYLFNDVKDFDAQLTYLSETRVIRWRKKKGKTKPSQWITLSGLE